jgi:subtilisin family serine protease
MHYLTDIPHLHPVFAISRYAPQFCARYQEIQETVNGGDPMRRFSFILLILSALLVNLAPAASAAPPVRSSYIVVLHDNEQSPAAAAREISDKVGGEVGFVYQYALKGFSITVPAQAVAGLRGSPRVKYVATDEIRYAFDQSIPTGLQRIFATGNSAIDIDNSDDKRVDVDVAVIDTGIDLQHPDLNVSGGVNCTGSPFNNQCVTGGDDDHYHGTHVAGIIGALDNSFGVAGGAPGARLWAVKVLNSRGSGYSSWIIAGIDWVAQNAATLEVANMSLGGSGFSQAEYDAIQGAVNKGIAFAVAAGNSDDNALNYSPAAFDNVLTVSALADFNGLPGGGAAATCRNDVDDTLADFSNWGTAVDIAAPGVCILSTFPLEKGEYGTISGTSMASPYAAGALALLASANKPANATAVGNLYSQVVNAGNLNWTDDSGDGIKERLLDVSKSSIFAPVMVAGGGSNTAPVVAITSPDDGASFASGTTINFTGTASDNEDGDLSGSLTWSSNLDESIGEGSSFSKVLSDGTHSITAAVTDSGGLNGSSSITVVVTEADGITLSVLTYKIKGNKYAELTWGETSWVNVDIYRNGTKIATTTNIGEYTDKPPKNTTSATYQVCESGTDTCSNSATVSW